MYNLAIRGGGKLSNYSFSFNAIDQEGLFINDDMQRYNSRLSFDSDVSKRFKVGAALGYTMTKRHSGAAGEENGMSDPMYPYTMKRENYTASTEL